MQAADLTAEFGIAVILDFVETEHGLVKAAISLDGVAGELYLQGAHLTAWRPPGERPVLFASPNSAFTPGRAIRGGIPIIFSRGSAPADRPRRRRSTASRAPRRGISMGSKPPAASR
jgi:alkanesulfonate monooxygenase SsuD/methylene tetrahydromethanopterin reductase-like flavin-dependent oxidoreductase (luciferase family)